MEQKLLETITEQRALLTEEVANASVFPGDVYTDRSRLPRRRWSLLSKLGLGKKRQLPRRNSKLKSIFFQDFEMVFLIGFLFDDKPLMYEIWYDSFNDTYIVLDGFATKQHEPSDTLEGAMEVFIDLIADRDPSVDANEAAKRKHGFERAAMKNKRSGKSRIDINMSEGLSFEEVTQLTEDFASTRNFISDTLNAGLKEYKRTRMNKRVVRSFTQFQKAFGKDVEFPNKFEPGFITRQAQKVFSLEKASTFVTGFTLADRIDVEIWHVKDRESNQGKYWVFNITSGEAIGANLTTLRSAYNAVAQKVAVPRDED